MPSCLLSSQLREGKKALAYMGAPSPLCAKMIEAQGYDGIYVGGSVVSTFGYGIADDGALTLSQLSRFVEPIAAATNLPVMVDADTGFSDDDQDVSDCVRVLTDAGASAIQIEDQIPAKKCGHLSGKQVISQAQMCNKIQSFVAARRDTNMLMVARTDARAVAGMEDALARAQAYAAAGADVVFVEALQSADEFTQAAQTVQAPLLANMTEFGRSPLLSRSELAAIGYAVVIYPATLMRLMLHTVEQALPVILENQQQHTLLKEMFTRQALYDLIEYKEPVP